MAGFFGSSNSVVLGGVQPRDTSHNGQNGNTRDESEPGWFNISGQLVDFDGERYFSLNARPEFLNTSIEEIRLRDYLSGNKQGTRVKAEVQRIKGARGAIEQIRGAPAPHVSLRGSMPVSDTTLSFSHVQSINSGNCLFGGASSGSFISRGQPQEDRRLHEVFGHCNPVSKNKRENSCQHIWDALYSENLVMGMRSRGISGTMTSPNASSLVESAPAKEIQDFRVSLLS